MIFGVKQETFIRNTIRSACLTEIKRLEKLLEKSRNKAEKWTEKTGQLTPRRGIRGGRATSNYAKMELAWQEVRRLEKQIEILNEELKR